MNAEHAANTWNLISIDYNSGDVPASVKQYRPILYKDGNEFCCLLGPDPQNGIFGGGGSIQEAIVDWDRHYHDYMQDADEEDLLLIRSWANND